MVNVRTLEALREHIRISLGAPSIQIEVTDDQLDICINKAISRYSEYAFGGTIFGTLLVELEEGKYDYILPPSITAVTGLSASSTYSTFVNIPAGYTLAMHPMTLNYMDNVSTIDVNSMTERMAQMSTIRNIFDVQVNYSFNENTGVLSFFEKPTSSVCSLEIGSKYVPGAIDNIYSNQWIIERSRGETLLAWSNIVGKYSTSLISGAEINYADLQSKGEAIIQQTEEELFNMMEPLGIYRA